MHGFIIETVTLFLYTAKGEYSSYCDYCKLRQINCMCTFKPEDQPEVIEMLRKQKSPILSVGISNTIASFYTSS